MRRRPQMVQIADLKKNIGISLERMRPARSEHRRLSLGETTGLAFYISPTDKDILQTEAKKRHLSLSLYLNLILHGQEKSPL